jgi:predicted MPP superfamily phosphohydrolase
MTKESGRKSRLWAAAGVVLSICLLGGAAWAEGNLWTMLRFKPDRTFKVVQFTDIQDDQAIDPRTVSLIEAALDDQRPDLVVFTGDNVTSGPRTAADVAKAIDNFAGPVDTRQIPWLATFGNHDEDHTPVTGVNEEKMLESICPILTTSICGAPGGSKGRET